MHSQTFFTTNFRSTTEIVDFANDLRIDLTHKVISNRGPSGIKPIFFITELHDGHTSSASFESLTMLSSLHQKTVSITVFDNIPPICPFSIETTFATRHLGG